VVGDGHKLSDFFEEESFDLIFLRLYLSAYTYHGLLLKKFKKYWKLKDVFLLKRIFLLTLMSALGMILIKS